MLVFQSQAKVPLANYVFMVQDLGKMVKKRKVHCNISSTFARSHKGHPKTHKVSVHTFMNHMHNGENCYLWFP